MVAKEGLRDGWASEGWIGLVKWKVEVLPGGPEGWMDGPSKVEGHGGWMDGRSKVEVKWG